MRYYHTVEAYLVTSVIAIRISMLSNTSYDFLSKEGMSMETFDISLY
jgi:hypothetical protein